MSAGYVYLFKVGGFHKIGRTCNVQDRAASFSKMPFPFEILHWFYSHDADADEKDLHEQYAPWRIKYEWFSLPDEQVVEIKAIVGDPGSMFTPPDPPPECAPASPDIVFSTRELAEYMRISEKHVFNLRRRGCPSFRHGKYVRFVLVDVLAWIQASGGKQQS
jgi:hypothetical protein